MGISRSLGSRVMSEQLVLRNTLSVHRGWVTQLATCPAQPNLLLSASRDKTLVVWDLNREIGGTPVAQRALHGHNHFVSDIVMSSDAMFALSASWDRTLRLWDLQTGKTTGLFSGHTGDVLSVAFSADNRQIVSGSRDKTTRLWNTLGKCKYIFEPCHDNWVSCVRFSPNTETPMVVTGGWDKMVKVWSLSDCRIRATHRGHSGYINSVTVSPDGSLCASGGKDGSAMLWDLTANKYLYTLAGGDMINALCFSPNRYWLCAATGSTIKIWDLENKVLADELRVEPVMSDTQKKKSPPQCTSLAWSGDGQTLFAGYTDNHIRMWQMMPSHMN